MGAMALDDVTLNETIDRVRAVLADSDRVDAGRIEVAEGDAGLVLRGAVPSAEQASVALLLAQRHADAVTNQLRVDANLREGPGVSGDEGNADVSPSEASPRDATEKALIDSEPLDPPDEPSSAVTAGEQTGVVDRDVALEEVAPQGEVPDDDLADASPSAPDLSRDELERSARGRRGPAADPTDKD